MFKLALGVDGILDVEVQEKATGLTKRARIDGATTRLTPDALAAARERTQAPWAEREDADDEPELREPAAVSGEVPAWAERLSQVVARATALLDKMSADDREEALDLIADAKAAIDEVDADAAQEAHDELEYIVHYV